MNPSATPEQARRFAVKAHGAQQYGDQPYVVHLDAVAGIVRPFGPFIEVLAYLHDVVEDTAETLQTVAAAFGEDVAENVSLLTDAPGANRKERKAGTYARLATVRPAHHPALVAKVGDRLANVRASVASADPRLLAIYRGEHPVFRVAAYRPGLCDALWSELDGLIGPMPA